MGGESAPEVASSKGACAFEMVLGPGEVPGMPEALMAAAKDVGAHLVSLGATHKVVRIAFDREVPQALIVEHLATALRGSQAAIVQPLWDEPAEA